MTPDSPDLFASTYRISDNLDTLLCGLGRDFLDHVRVAKLQEEAGEAYAALLGMQGLNPRKGVTGDQTKLREELADVVVCALGALHHFTGSASLTEVIVTERAAHVAARLTAVRDEVQAAYAAAHRAEGASNG